MQNNKEVITEFVCNHCNGTKKIMIDFTTGKTKDCEYCKETSNVPEKKIIYRPTSKVNGDKITIYGAGKFSESSMTLDKSEAALLLAELYGFVMSESKEEPVPIEEAAKFMWFGKELVFNTDVFGKNTPTITDAANWQKEQDDILTQREICLAYAKGLNDAKEQDKAIIVELLELKKSFYMNICRAYNAGKQNAIEMVAENKRVGESIKSFKSSHDYFITEFPKFKTNVP